MTERQGIEARTRAAVELARCGQTEATVEVLAQLVCEPTQATSRAATELLTAANASMLTELARTDLDDAALQVEIKNDIGDVVDIDELEPPVRAGVRAMLAEANGHPADTQFQLDLAFRDRDPTAATTVMMNTLLWTLDLLEGCERQGLPVPVWLR